MWRKRVCEMEATEDIKCPYCRVIQSDDIHDLVEGGDMEGQFEHKCESCEKNFKVGFEIVTKVRTYKS